MILLRLVSRDLRSQPEASCHDPSVYQISLACGPVQALFTRLLLSNCHPATAMAAA